MGQEYGIVYAAINVFCVIYAAIVWRKLSGNMGSERQIMYFKRMILSYICFTATEALWALGNFGVVQMPTLALTLLSSITLISAALIALYWFAYGETKMGFRLTENPLIRLAVNAPIILLSALYVVSIFNGMMFHYDADGKFVQGPFYNLSAVVDILYLSIVSVHAFIESRRATTSARRHECLMLLPFVIPPAIAGFIDTFHPNLPLITLAVFCSILLVFTSVQESQIFNDALTGLNNRRRANAYLEDLLENTGREKAFYLFMLDVDLFKNINDNHGHIEGDRALGILADAIRKTCQHYRSFVARWGGDEFLMVAEEANIDSPQAVTELFKKQLVQECTDRGIGYPLEVSVGWTRCDNPRTPISSLIEQADTMLYEQKRIAHASAAKKAYGTA